MLWGRVLDLTREPQPFDARLRHCVTVVESGERLSFFAFTRKELAGKLANTELDELLRNFGFPVPALHQRRQAPPPVVLQGPLDKWANDRRHQLGR